MFLLCPLHRATHTPRKQCYDLEESWSYEGNQQTQASTVGGEIEKRVQSVKCNRSRRPNSHLHQKTSRSDCRGVYLTKNFTGTAEGQLRLGLVWPSSVPSPIPYHGRAFLKAAKMPFAHQNTTKKTFWQITWACPKPTRIQ